MEDNNPLKKYFRQPAIYMRLPTGGRWYNSEDVDVNDNEIPIYGLTAIDEVLLNTPDAMLNGTSLEKVITNCAPSVKNVKKLMIPDLEALFVAIKVATTGTGFEFDRTCPKCGHENHFEINCQALLDNMSLVEEDDTIVNFDSNLIIYVKPYTLEMRQQFMQREFEEERTLKIIDNSNKDLSEFEKAKILAESIEKISRITFELASKSISKIEIVSQGTTVSDSNHINEWLTSINKVQADSVLNAINGLNEVGIHKESQAKCEECGNEWEEKLNFDPVNFFGRR